MKDMTNQNQKAKPLEVVVYDDLTPEQKEEIRIAFVKKQKAEAETATIEANNASAESKKNEAEIRKTNAETKKLKIEAGVAIAGVSVLAIGTILGNIVPCIELEKNRIHHDNEEMKYSETEKEIETNFIRSLIQRMSRR